MTLCKRVYYTGNVQGVGFRYTAQRIAHGFAVAGFVRNLPSGEVELVAEGDVGEVNAFLAAVAQRMARYIQQTRETEENPSGFQDFGIRY
jgi:acylphosphatase